MSSAPISPNYDLEAQAYSIARLEQAYAVMEGRIGAIEAKVDKLLIGPLHSLVKVRTFGGFSRFFLLLTVLCTTVTQPTQPFFGRIYGGTFARWYTPLGDYVQHPTARSRDKLFGELVSY